MARQSRIAPLGEIVADREWLMCVTGGRPRFNSLASKEELHRSSRATRNDRGRRRARRLGWLDALAQHEGDHRDKVHEDCLKACESCERFCNVTFHHCSPRSPKGRRNIAKAMHLVVDCARFCDLSADLIASQSPLMVHACLACSEACKACATECDRFDSAEMKSCVKACRECETTCRAMVKAMGHDHHG